ncbi:DUF4145 domain-containing protein [Globicatella sulfidifaciens]|nr:DUF4145 domain-containing protein [Globicatella sulfidifaciens]
MTNYFYGFLEIESMELAKNLDELENAIYRSPRSMLTHSRTFIEVLLEKVMIHENIPNEKGLKLIDRINILDSQDLLTQELRNAFHEIRKLGNSASHNPRKFRFSESLQVWEYIYTIMTWYIEVYISHDLQVPEYIDPLMKQEKAYDLGEVEIRLEKMESLLKASLEKERDLEEGKKHNSEDSHEEPSGGNTQPVLKAKENLDKEPGFTVVRTISFGDEKLDIPYFLRDAFLLPQRFENSKSLLLNLKERHQARMMSEVPNTLENFHIGAKRYKEEHSAYFFEDLKEFIAEEIRRKNLYLNRPGELFLFYKSSEIIVTEKFGKQELTTENIKGMPSLIEQLHEDGIMRVRDLPQELVILDKYETMGTTKVKNFFQQLVEIQQKTQEESNLET